MRLPEAPMSETKKVASQRLKWEYMSCAQDRAEEQDEFLLNLNELGAEGWEAFGAVQELAQKPPHLTVFLKRQVASRR
jgi:hypothetical protein